MNEVLRSASFWAEIRLSAGIEGLGEEQCEQWCRAALKNRLVRRHFWEEIAFLGDVDIASRTPVQIHHWLRSDDFSADGTAGQYDHNYPLGYYGKIENASDILRRIYDIQMPR